MKKKIINIDDKELDRDIRNLSIPWEDQHIPYVKLEDMDFYSDEAKEEIRQTRKERQERAKRNENNTK